MSVIAVRDVVMIMITLQNKQKMSSAWVKVMNRNIDKTKILPIASCTLRIAPNAILDLNANM
jgi:hypothetical protein